MRPIVEHARVISLPGGEVPTQIYAPADLAAPPALLFYHGLGASRDVHGKEGRSLAAAGFAAIVPDAPHHGARRSSLLDALARAEGVDVDRLLLRIVREAAAEVPPLVDRLLAAGHPAVAIAGVSMGAYIALAAGADDRRLAAVVSILGSPDWTPRSGELPPDLAALVAGDPLRRLDAFPPRPLLLLNAGRDQSVPPEPARRFAAALRPRYAAAGASERLVHREYPDAGHFMPERDWDDLWSTTLAFLARALPGG